MRLKSIFLLFTISFIFITSCVDDTPIDDIMTDPPLELTEDPTDYSQGVQPIAQFYQNDPIKYFAEFGLISIVSHANILVELGIDPLLAFHVLAPYFDENLAMQAINNQNWQAEFVNKMMELSQLPLWDQWVHAIMCYGTEAGQMLLDDPQNPNLGMYYMYLGDGINYAMQPDFFELVAPETDMSNITPQSLPNEICWCEMELFPVPSCDRPNKGADDNGTAKKNWVDVRTSYNTSKDGMCATLASGLCLAKLKQIGSQVDGKTWNDISCKIKARESGGAYNSDINDYYRSLGYEVTVVYDGLGFGSKTAVNQVKDALARGCDVKIVYHDGSWVGGSQHMEFVHSIDVDKDDMDKAKVTTHSWGDTTTVTYDGDTFSGKSDGATYGAKSYLNKTGSSWFLIYCKK